MQVWPDDIRAAVGRLAWLGAGPVLVATVLGWLGGLAWWLDLFAHPRLAYALACLLLIAPAIAAKRWVCLTLLIFALIGNLYTLWPLYWPAPASRASGAVAVELLHFNVKTENEHPKRVMRYIDKSDADIVLLQEVSPRWQSHLQGLKGYDIKRSRLRRDNFGIALLVAKDPASPIASIETQFVTGRGLTIVPVIEAKVVVDDRTLHMLSLHTLPPMSAKNARLTDRMLTAAARWVDRCHTPAVVIGDLNATPWCQRIQPLHEETRLRNARRGFGYDATWPSMAPLPFVIPIDHCLHTPELVTLNHEVGPALGSDHHALSVTLGVPPQATATTDEDQLTPNQPDQN
jgi:endonuclease/exonuclease/phosphatase (EEP) superfamily protein YafD